MSKIEGLGALLNNDVPSESQSLEKILSGETKVNSNTFPITNTQTNTSRRKRKLFEDERKRCTYWLSAEEINMLNEISESEDKPKYEVLGEAIKMFYKKRAKQK